MFSDSLGGSLKPKKPAFKNRQVVDWNSCVGRCKRKQLALLLVISTTSCLMKNSCLPFNGSFMRLWLRLARQSKQVWLKTKSRSGELTRQPILLIIGSFTLQTNTQILFSNKFGSHKSVTRVLQKGLLCPTWDIFPQAGKEPDWGSSVHLMETNQVCHPSSACPLGGSNISCCKAWYSTLDTSAWKSVDDWFLNFQLIQLIHVFFNSLMSYNLYPTIMTQVMLGGFLLLNLYIAYYNLPPHQKNTTPWRTDASPENDGFPKKKSLRSITQYALHWPACILCRQQSFVACDPACQRRPETMVASPVKLESMGLYRGKTSQFEDQETKLQWNFSENEQHAPLLVRKSIFPTNPNGTCYMLVLRRVGILGCSPATVATPFTVAANTYHKF